MLMWGPDYIWFSIAHYYPYLGLPFFCFLFQTESSGWRSRVWGLSLSLCCGWRNPSTPHVPFITVFGWIFCLGIFGNCPFVVSWQTTAKNINFEYLLLLSSILPPIFWLGFQIVFIFKVYLRTLSRASFVGTNLSAYGYLNYFLGWKLSWCHNLKLIKVNKNNLKPKAATNLVLSV